MRGYVVNEIFYSLQGEGVRAGTPNLFLRLSRCNLACKVETHGFDCDTEFESGRAHDARRDRGGAARSSPPPATG